MKLYNMAQTFGGAGESEDNIDCLIEDLESLSSNLQTKMKEVYNLGDEVKLFKENVERLFKCMAEFKILLKDDSLSFQSEELQVI